MKKIEIYKSFLKWVSILLLLLVLFVSGYIVYNFIDYSKNNHKKLFQSYINPIPSTIVFVDSGVSGIMEPCQFHYVQLTPQNFDDILKYHQYRKIDELSDDEIKSIADPLEEDFLTTEYKKNRYNQFIRYYKNFDEKFELPFDIKKIDLYEIYYRTDISNSYHIFLIVNREHSELLALYTHM
ncbi:MAG: hypothetical protein PHO36_15370 [Parabacteroides sp.]|nr:hypothetical protein [Parabacteroides sp.]